jgi:UDP-N-acetyl-D-glucosamine dehydrogenase
MSFKGQVAVLGQGYVGLPLAMAAAKAGWRVYGIDVQPNRIEMLNSGISFIEDVQSEEISANLLSGSYIPTLDFEVIGQCEIAVICVPTPIKEDKTPNLDYLNEAVDAIAENANNGLLLINESTSFPTTLSLYIPDRVRRVRLNLEILYAVAPERIDPANTRWGFKETPRLVSGLTPDAEERAKAFYESFCDSVLSVGKPEIAELSKLLENTYRQVNIALVNELVPLCMKLGISLFDVIDAASTKPYGYSPFYPGVGVGGHCIPVDPHYLNWKSRDLGSEVSLISAADNINKAMPSLIVELVQKIVGESAPKILQIGITYKKGVRDLRDSPSLDLLFRLQKKYTNVEWWDELVEEFDGQNRSNLLDMFDLIIVTQQTNHDFFTKLLTNAKFCLDLTGQFRGISKVVSI